MRVHPHRMHVARLVVTVIHRMRVGAARWDDELARPTVLQGHRNGCAVMSIRMESRAIVGIVDSVALLDRLCRPGPTLSGYGARKKKGGEESACRRKGEGV